MSESPLAKLKFEDYEKIERELKEYLTNAEFSLSSISTPVSNDPTNWDIETTAWKSAPTMVFKSAGGEFDGRISDVRFESDLELVNLPNYFAVINSFMKENVERFEANSGSSIDFEVNPNWSVDENTLRFEIEFVFQSTNITDLFFKWFEMIMVKSTIKTDTSGEIPIFNVIASISRHRLDSFVESEKVGEAIYRPIVDTEEWTKEKWEVTKASLPYTYTTTTLSSHD